MKNSLKTLLLATIGGTLAAWFIVREPTGVAAEASGAVVGEVKLTKDGVLKADRSGLVVYLEGVPNSEPRPQPEAVRKISQRDKQFTPAVLVVEKGTTVEFPNDDKIFHNVFSLSRTARFDLGLYKSGDSKSVKMRRAGEVDVYCNIHPQMVSKILVVDTKYHASTDKQGRFRIDNVPPGNYGIVGWQPYGERFKGRVEVTASGVATVSFTLKEGEKDTRHQRKDGTPYGRYE